MPGTTRCLLWALPLGLSAGCLPFGDDEIVTDPKKVGAYARIRIPASATGLIARTEAGIDRLTYGRFDIPAADLPDVLASLPSDHKTGASGVFVHKFSEPWWRPEEIADPKSAEASAPGFAWKLLYGDSGTPGTVTVYFVHFEL
mgnify:CR=1 FL=1